MRHLNFSSVCVDLLVMIGASKSIRSEYEVSEVVVRSGNAGVDACVPGDEGEAVEA